ncbi:TPA: DUF1073 domain-containing protein [Campylobacter jejuni]|nr:DUF1073 domain-containing protein [Campylobacter jejuni]
MFFFDSLFKTTSDFTYTQEDDEICKCKDLSYKECMNIYYYNPLGKRIARALPNFAMSADRDIIFEGMPTECVDRFREIETDLEIHKLVKKLATYARVFGLAGLYISHSKIPSDKPLTFKDIEDSGQINFNILDPLNLNGIEIDQDPLSISYQKVKSVTIDGKVVNSSRCYCVFNDLTFYLKFTPSTFNFGSPSVYQNMRNLLVSWQRCMDALERAATKAGSIIYKGRDGGVINSVTIEAARKTLNIINNLKTHGIAEVEKGTEIEFFSLTGVGEIDKIIEQMNQIILMALSDTPAAILLDKELAQGFGNGEEDMKAILMAVDDYRRGTLQGIFNFVDKYIMYVAFNSAFIADLKNKYPQDFKKLSIVQIRENIIKSYKFEWGNLYPETEATKCDNNSKKLDNLLKLKELGAITSDIEAIINNDKDLYSEEITLEEKVDDISEDDSEDFESFVTNTPGQATETTEDINKDTD